MSQNAFSRHKRIPLKTKKADQKNCENWRRGSGSEFHKTSPACERGEWRKQLQDFITQSHDLKQIPRAPVQLRAFFGLMGHTTARVHRRELEFEIGANSSSWLEILRVS